MRPGRRLRRPGSGSAAISRIPHDVSGPKSHATGGAGMRFDEFEKLVASEPPRTAVVTVAVRDPEVLERAKKSGGMLMTDFLASKPVRTEQREVRDEHVLG